MPILETMSGVTMPADYSFECINNFVHCESPDYEDLQNLALGMSSHIEALERKLAEARKDAARYRMSSLNDDLRDILGFMCFQYISIAKLLRTSGYEIKTKAEDEQATVIHWLLSLYAEHGSGWRESARVALKAMGESIDEATKGR